MYYMNFVFAVLGYRVFTVYPAYSEGGDRISRADAFVLLSTRRFFVKDQEITAVRISNSVYFETRVSL